MALAPSGKNSRSLSCPSGLGECPPCLKTDTLNSVSFQETHFFTLAPVVFFPVLVQLENLVAHPVGHFAAFAGASAKCLGEREEELMKKRGRQTGKERFTIHASLCGGGDLLKALGSVASYLADRLFNLSNDS